MNSNPLMPVWDIYKASKNCFRITKNVVKHHERDSFLQDTDFISKDKNEIFEIIGKGLKESKDLFVVDLWATFERFIRDYLQDKALKLQQVYPTTIGGSMYLYVEGEIEFWKPEDILEKILKNTLSPSSYLVGQAKQILQYRNWIAHGKNPNKTTARITPEFAHQVLNEIVTILLAN